MDESYMHSVYSAYLGRSYYNLYCFYDISKKKKKHLKNNAKLKTTTALIPLYITDFDSYPLKLLVSCSLKSYLSAFTYFRSLKQASVTTVQI